MNTQQTMNLNVFSNISCLYLVLTKRKELATSNLKSIKGSNVEQTKRQSKSALGKWTLNAISAIYNAKHYVTQMAKPSLITRPVFQSAKSVFVFVKGKGKV